MSRADPGDTRHFPYGYQKHHDGIETHLQLILRQLHLCNFQLVVQTSATLGLTLQVPLSGCVAPVDGKHLGIGGNEGVNTVAKDSLFAIGVQCHARTPGWSIPLAQSRRCPANNVLHKTMACPGVY